jgi:hypothetical protein
LILKNLQIEDRLHTKHKKPKPEPFESFQVPNNGRKKKKALAKRNFVFAKAKRSHWTAASFFWQLESNKRTQSYLKHLGRNKELELVFCSVPDPDDPYVFGSLGSESNICTDPAPDPSINKQNN